MELGPKVVPVPSTRQPHAAPSFQLPAQGDQRSLVGVLESDAQIRVRVELQHVVVDVRVVLLAEDFVLAVA